MKVSIVIPVYYNEKIYDPYIRILRKNLLTK